MRISRFAVGVALALLASCTDSGRLGGGSSDILDAGPGADGQVDGVSGSGDIGTLGGSKDTGSATADAGGGDTGGGIDIGPPNECPEAPYAFGCACEGNDDCASGWCVEAITGHICTQECISECPNGWACLPVHNVGEDVAYICVPSLPELCAPCAADKDCGGPVDLCVGMGAKGDTVCTGACAPGNKCPAGFICAGVTSVDGTSAAQCVPVTNSCECTDELDGTSQPCAVQNEHGKCYGERVCNGAQGWTSCSAKQPAVETCNGLDDDCDGEADEDLADEPCTVQNEHGGCPGTAECQGKKGYVCLGTAAKAETCNGLDDDCDGQVDEGMPDLDGDGTPDCTDDDMDGDGSPNGEDCAPLDAAIHKGATESCNGKDDDCDGQTDEEGATGCTDAWADKDGDSWGAGTAVCGCAAFPGWALKGGDCNDLDPKANPGAIEVCGGGDEDCDGEVDEGDAACFDAWNDKDGDGFGGGTPSCVCVLPAGWVTKGGDCDDLNGKANPDGAEACGGGDEDCDGQVDEGAAVGCLTWYLDADKDGWGIEADSTCSCKPAGSHTAPQAGDCADGNPAVSPGAAESCNGQDDDCDGQVDEPGASGCSAAYQDVDQDGYGDSGATACLCAPDAVFTVSIGGDCADGDPSIHPAAAESCNGQDDDCDGSIDEVDADGCEIWYQDKDGDGYGNPAVAQCLCAPSGDYTASGAGDCLDVNVSIHPGAPELCNGLDDDCNGIVDDGAQGGCLSYYADEDGDGWGDPNKSACVCAATAPYVVLQGGDCYDQDPSINPGAPEVCNGQDDDCDGIVDEANAVGCQAWFEDLDGDGWGTTNAQCLCKPGAVFTSEKPGDCNDFDASIKPGAIEICDGVDDNCSGMADEGCDQDGDGWCTATKVVVISAACPKGGGDCNDATPSVNPGVPESCNGIDDNCDGEVDEGVQAPCGGCSKVCQFKLGPGETAEFDPASGDGTGLSDEGWIKLDSSSIKFTMLWVANSGEGSISKIDTESGKETARYWVCSDPSRTAVDLDGAAWVGCRGDGKVAKIALDPAKCIDKNGNGAIETSKDLDGNGVISGGELLPAGTDECVLFVVQPDGATVARALAVDKDNYAWVGFWNSRKLHRLHPTTGASVASVDLTSYASGRPYGMALDQKGRIWVSLRDGSPPGLAMVDVTQFPITPKVWGTPGSHNTYGMAVDSLGRVWLAGGEGKLVSRFDPDTQAWKTTNLGAYPNVRGIAASTDGKVYAAHHNFDSDCNTAQDHYVSVFDAASGNHISVIDTNTGNPKLGPTGVAIDFAGYLWAINMCSSNATKIDRATETVVGHYPTGPSPYTYSDMTGFALKTVVAPEGLYLHTFTGWEDAPTRWYQILASTSTPNGTWVELRYRTANTIAGLDLAAWSPSKGPYPPELMPLDLTQEGDIVGKHLQVEVKLVSSAVGQTPILKSLLAVAAQGQ
ncbi:MAG: hypothetical protein AMXMBFR64_30650 [Myxococcales bacterium]